MRRMMTGRYGSDQLGMALLGLYLVLYLLSRMFHSRLLSWLGLAVILWGFYRMLSRQIPQRQAENARFLEAVGPMVRKYNVNKCRRQDKEHCYFKCPNCGQYLRVPRGKGRITVNCRSCGISFEEKS